MVHVDSGLPDPPEILRRFQTVRRTQSDLGIFPVHGCISLHRQIQVFSCQSSSGCHNGKTVDSLCRMISALLHNSLRVQKSVLPDPGPAVNGLGAESAVFRTPPAASVDNGTKIHPAAAECLPDIVRSFQKFFQFPVHKDPAFFFIGKPETGDDPFSEF